MNNNQDQVCENCGKKIVRCLGCYGDKRYRHELPEGELYSQQKQDFPDCWNDPRPKPKPAPQVEKITIEPGLSVHDRWTAPKPTPDPKVEQVAKRPTATDGAEWRAQADLIFESQDDKIASLEKELRVYKRALEMACAFSAMIVPDIIEQWREAARKEQG